MLRHLAQGHLPAADGGVPEGGGVGRAGGQGAQATDIAGMSCCHPLPTTIPGSICSCLCLILQREKKQSVLKPPFASTGYRCCRNVLQPSFANIHPGIHSLTSFWSGHASANGSAWSCHAIQFVVLPKKETRSIKDLKVEATPSASGLWFCFCFYL